MQPYAPGGEENTRERGGGDTPAEIRADVYVQLYTFCLFKLVQINPRFMGTSKYAPHILFLTMRVFSRTSRECDDTRSPAESRPRARSTGVSILFLLEGGDFRRATMSREFRSHSARCRRSMMTRRLRFLSGNTWPKQFKDSSPTSPAEVQSARRNITTRCNFAPIHHGVTSRSIFIGFV